MSAAVGLSWSLSSGWRDAARAAGLEPIELPGEGATDLPESRRAGVQALVAGGFPASDLIRQADALPDLRWIHVPSSGVNRLDLDALSERGLVVTNSSGCFDIPAGEHVLGAMLAHARRFLPLHEAQGERVWRADLRVNTLARSTVGILGFGSLGREVARLAKAFRMRVVAMKAHPGGKRWQNVDKLHGPEGVGRVLRAADHVVVTLPLTDATRGLLDEERLALFREGASLVNVSRGAVVDERALLDALDAGRPAAAYLDVFGEEPLPKDHPFWTHERVFVTPHASGRGGAVEGKILDLFRKNGERFVSAGGDPSAAKLLNVVDLEAGY